ncbi:hypothetical protein [Micromonospora sagamiensis]|nr:hypothetical protein [Micromonospora sagamiensis]
MTTRASRPPAPGRAVPSGVAVRSSGVLRAGPHVRGRRRPHSMYASLVGHPARSVDGGEFGDGDGPQFGSGDSAQVPLGVGMGFGVGVGSGTGEAVGDGVVGAGRGVREGVGFGGDGRSGGASVGRYAVGDVPPTGAADGAPPPGERVGAGTTVGDTGRGGPTTTGPREGVGMNGVSAFGNAVPPTVADPALIAARIGMEAVPASRATVNR